MPIGHSLSELRIIADGHRVIVREEGSAWNPESGQLQIDFAVSNLTGRPGPIARKLVRSAEKLSASDWFDLGVDLEASAPEEACSAYVRALALDSDLAEAHVNLGRLLQLAGRTAEAVEHYRRSLEDGRSDPTAAFNLGTALEESGQWAEAIEAYRRALRDDHQFADAHFNLARLYEQVGRRSAAIRHLRAYQQLSKEV